MSGDVVAITGAASGIGRALALECARSSWCKGIALADMNGAGLDEVKELCEKLALKRTTERGGFMVSIHNVNVRYFKDLERFLEETLRAHENRCSILINNAGVVAGGPFQEMPKETFDFVMDINFAAVVNLTRIFLPILRKERKAHIVNISSMYGLLPTRGTVAYHGSKFAVTGFTQSLSIECQEHCPQVVCHSVHPGFINTDLLKNGRNFKPNSFKSEEEDLLDKVWDIITITSAEDAAQSILSQVKADQRHIIIGPDAYLNHWIANFVPRGLYLNNYWLNTMLIPVVAVNSILAAKIRNMLCVGDRTSLALLALAQYFTLNKIRSFF